MIRYWGVAIAIIAVQPEGIPSSSSLSTDTHLVGTHTWLLLPRCTPLFITRHYGPPRVHLLLLLLMGDKSVRRRFRASNYQSTTRVKPFICTMPMRLDEGWNQIQFNLADFTRRAYGTNYVETLRVQIHANCRIRRVYFSDRLYSEDELPAEFKLFLPIQKPQSKAIAQQAC
ncbi:cilia- and flagella-associated protein 20-like [Anopheles aquasalis]|uniref:cilia- and flagella-associated protein 20-like n=1 Tax=Anopheles aquasalis TaxID=42839 RepID=UPI00215B11C9|nr:cilia- and flagella-associated protein 20-like [Anopheles aquasalis]